MRAAIGATGELDFESSDVQDGDEVVRVTDPVRSGFLEWEKVIEATSLVRSEPASSSQRADAGRFSSER